ncbi:hypothetical protein HJFPF1_08746 [Paramyrothecium foliicola]|nr:hypothetical protein HJFPF1_08746 [Paramyrothecium foliicola]
MYPGSPLTASNSTYHSFNDIELFEPPSPPKKTIDSMGEERPLTAVKMQRQDSGYESYNASPSPRNSTSTSTSRPSVARRTSNGSSGAGSSRARTRPSAHRSAKSYPPPKPRPSFHHARSNSIQPQTVSYFHFPSPEPIELVSNSPVDMDATPQSPVLPPPQTTHYWTSDRTRRLEYAAIDAASRGVKGWIRRTLIPDCFVPQESKHVSFDDDTGSVRRYRLELEEEDMQDEKTPRRRKSWRFWSRKNTV